MSHAAAVNLSPLGLSSLVTVRTGNARTKVRSVIIIILILPTQSDRPFDLQPIRCDPSDDAPTATDPEVSAFDSEV